MRPSWHTSQGRCCRRVWLAQPFSLLIHEVLPYVAETAYQPGSGLSALRPETRCIHPTAFSLWWILVKQPRYFASAGLLRLLQVIHSQAPLPASGWLLMRK